MCAGSGLDVSDVALEAERLSEALAVDKEEKLNEALARRRGDRKVIGQGP